jgi:hypothetical protein
MLIVGVITTFLFNPLTRAGDAFLTKYVCTPFPQLAFLCPSPPAASPMTISPLSPDQNTAPQDVCDLTRPRFPCWYITRADDTLSGISRKFFQTEKYWKHICDENESLLEAHFQAEASTIYKSRCEYIHRDWKLLISEPPDFRNQ